MSNGELIAPLCTTKQRIGRHTISSLQHARLLILPWHGARMRRRSRRSIQRHLRHQKAFREGLPSGLTGRPPGALLMQRKMPPPHSEGISAQFS